METERKSFHESKIKNPQEMEWKNNNGKGFKFAISFNDSLYRAS